VDVIVTSPPYNINKNYRSYVDKKERNEYLSWLSEIARTSYTILKNEASFFLNVSGAPSDSLLPLEVAKAFFDSGYKLQNTIHWIKSISIEKEDLAKTGSFSQSKNVSLGHFKPIISQRFLNDFHEYIFHFTKDGDVKLDKLAIGVPYQDKSNIGRWKSSKEDKRDRGNVWFIPYQTIRKERPHPAIFPERLPYLCIKLHGIKKGMLVYDPFMGIGNTALACIQLNVNFIGTEIDYGYIQSAKERIDNLLYYGSQ
jgi:site-specific DNA-methyltransferase (adenine-specific)